MSYLKVQHLLSEDDLFHGSNPPLLKHRRPGPKHPNYGLPAELWSTIVHRVVEQKEPLRTVAAANGVSHETIRRLLAVPSGSRRWYAVLPAFLASSP